MEQPARSTSFGANVRFCTTTSGHVCFCAAVRGIADINPASDASHAPIYEYTPSGRDGAARPAAIRAAGRGRRAGGVGWSGGHAGGRMIRFSANVFDGRRHGPFGRAHRRGRADRPVLALWLARLGVKPRIIDKTAEPGKTLARAGGARAHARALPPARSHRRRDRARPQGPGRAALGQGRAQGARLVRGDRLGADALSFPAHTFRRTSMSGC